jgi:hypothetical protein
LSSAEGDSPRLVKLLWGPQQGLSLLVPPLTFTIINTMLLLHLQPPINKKSTHRRKNQEEEKGGVTREKRNRTFLERIS